MSFEPNADFLKLPPDERSRFIFPADWDLSRLEEPGVCPEKGKSCAAPESSSAPGNAAGRTVRKSRGAQVRRAPECDPDPAFEGLDWADMASGDFPGFSGDVWLLEELAGRCGLVRDLNVSLNEDGEAVRDVLALAVHACAAESDFSSVEAWQSALAGTPARERLVPARLQRLADSLSTLHLEDFLRLRTGRADARALCAVVSRTAAEDEEERSRPVPNLAARRGARPDRQELVTWDKISGLPCAWTRSACGCAADLPAAVLRRIEQSGQTGTVLYADEACAWQYTPDRALRAAIRLAGRAPVSLGLVAARLRAYGAYERVPASMTFDPALGLHVERFAENPGGGTDGKGAKLTLTLYFDPEWRGRLVRMQETAIEAERALLEEYLDPEIFGDGLPEEYDMEYLRGQAGHFVLDMAEGRLRGYAPDTEAAERERLGLGFLPLVSAGPDLSPAELFGLHELKGRQEEYFDRMRLRMIGWPGDRSGRGRNDALHDLTLFAGFVLAAALRRFWESAGLKGAHEEPEDLLDALRAVSCRRKNGRLEPVRVPDMETGETLARVRRALAAFSAFGAREAQAASDAAGPAPGSRSGKTRS
ncbi:MAG: hypothetical protein Q4F72_09090 [Desulfovibrionaceae bacterium]|nr:hypothetical protein [Desulfovibrionaceae bacterium]